MDIVPTLIELLGLPRDMLELDGQSLLVPLMAPERVPADRPIYCYICRLFKRRRDFFIESVRVGRHHLQRDLVASDVALYDIAADPAEHTDIADDPAHQERRKELEALLSEARTGNILDVRRSGKRRLATWPPVGLGSGA